MTDDSTKYAVRLEDLALGYPKRVLYENVTLGFARGELIALIGRNGTGKSTLLRAVMGLMKPLRGEIRIEGRPLSGMSPRQRASRVGFVSTEEARVNNLRVADAVGLGRAPYTDWIGKLRETDREVVVRSLRRVGMEAFADKSLDTLSDGERQRVMIARALAQDTPIILLDEPTAFLDLPNKYEIGLLLRSLAHEEGKTVLFSTHDLNIALELCDTMVLIEGGAFAYGPPAELIRQGAVGRLFEGTSVEFDREKRCVRLKK